MWWCVRQATWAAGLVLGGWQAVPVSAIERLLQRSSEPLAASIGDDVGRGHPLDELVGRRNGFYAFAGALHVRPSVNSGAEIGLDDWNDPELWRNGFESLGAEWLCFAEDAFGGQFAIRDGSVATFDPETGEVEVMGSSIEEWASQILDDHEVLTGWPLADAWQQQNGPLLPGRRLLPRIPFMLGGEFVVENLYDADAVLSLRYRAEIANQIAELPDGATVQLRVVD